MGGRGSASGKSGGGGGGSGKITNERSFSASELKTGRDRTGEPSMFNEGVRAYADDVARSVKPGDQVIVEKTFKSGETATTTFTVKTTTTQWRNGTTTKGLGVNVSGDKRDVGYTSPEFFGRVGKSSGVDLAAFMGFRRSSVKSVTVKVKHR